MTPIETPPEQRIQALNTSLTESTKVISELVSERNGLLRDNTVLRVKLMQALEHLQTSRLHAMKLAEELEHYRK